VWLVTAVLASRFLILGWRDSVNILNWDQWDFYTPLFKQASLWEIFRWQHGPIREGLGLVLDKFLLEATAWNTRVETFFIFAAIVLATISALLLKKKLFGALIYWDVLIPIVFLSLTQYEGLTLTPNPAYSAVPLVMIVLYGLALLQQNALLRYGCVLLLNALLIYTGFGFFMGIVTPLLLAVEIYRSFRTGNTVPAALPIAALMVAAASLASFFAGYRSNSAAECFVFPDPHPARYLLFLALMFARFIGLQKPVIVAVAMGLALLAAALLAFARQINPLLNRSAAGVHSVIAVLLGFSLMFGMATAIGRTCLGLPGAALASRYTSLLIPAFLALYFYLLSQPKSSRQTAMLWILLIAVLPASIVKTKGFHYNDGKRAWKKCYLQTENVELCDQQSKPVYPWAKEASFRGKLDYLKRNQLNLFADEK
jgi:hypothetical protein